MEDFVLSIAAKIAEYVVDPILHHAQYLCCFNNFASNFPNAKEQLELTRDRVNEQIREAINKVEKVEPSVEKWLKDVEKVLEEVQILEEKILHVNKSCFRRQCQYSLAKEIERKTPEMIQFHRNSKFESFSRITELPSMKYYSSNDFFMFNSTEESYKKLLEALKNKSAFIIGLGGSGKTTLAKEVGKKAEEMKLFEKVVLATIVDQLGFKLMEESDIGRAQRLSERLRKATTLEAWTLFRHHANITDDSSKPLKGVARKNVNECKGLPIAIVTDCEIDLEDLFRFGRGFGTIGTFGTMENARREMDAAIDMLKNCFLLMHAKEKQRVKMHDLVRDVALWIASKSGQTIFTRTKVDPRVLEDEEVLKDMKAIVYQMGVFKAWKIWSGHYYHMITKENEILWSITNTSNQLEAFLKFRELWYLPITNGRTRGHYRTGVTKLGYNGDFGRKGGWKNQCPRENNGLCEERREVLKYIKNHFLRGYESGKEVTTMLEANRTQGEWKSLEEELPPPKPPDLNWRAVASGVMIGYKVIDCNGVNTEGRRNELNRIGEVSRTQTWKAVRSPPERWKAGRCQAEQWKTVRSRIEWLKAMRARAERWKAVKNLSGSVEELLS
ncbi:hypothetical protein V8G54_035154 [Vigna mungo]|uniref:Disease resistance protein n=1 Tax=Vigna mungo TaxID=3915 RepID=A0AAQ3MEK9_VIGMU